MGFYDSIIIFYRIVTTFSTLFSYDGCTAILLTFTKIIIFFCSRNYRNFLFERKMWYENHILFIFWCQFILLSKPLEFEKLGSIRMICLWIMDNNECTLIILLTVFLCVQVVKRNHTAHLVNSNSGWRISKLYRISFCLSLSSCYQTFALQIRKQISHLKSLAVVFSFQAQI